MKGLHYYIMASRLTLLFAVFYFLTPNLANAQYNIEFEVENYENDTLLVGYYYGDRQLVQDTLFTEEKGQFTLQGADTLDAGMYLALTKPDNNFVQFFVPEDDKEFKVKFDGQDLTKLSFEGSDDNEVFIKYVEYLADMRERVAPIREAIDEKKEAGLEPDPSLQDKLDELDKEVKAKQKDFIAKHPGTMTANLLKANTEVEVPDFEDVPESDRPLKQYHYYKSHYFDNIDFGFDGLVRMPYYGEKISTYFDKLVPQAPDSINKEVDYLLGKLEGNEDAYRFTLSNLLSKYASMKYVGHDAIYVHMVDNYYSNGKAPWIDAETKEKLSKNSDDLRPLLIGKTFPNIQTYKQDNTPVKLHDISSKYTVVMFWKYDCGHCKKAMPFVVDFYKEYKDKGVKLITICTNSGKKADKCWESIEEKNMGDFINTGDPYQRYRKEVKIRSTPKIFILDENKEIVIKDIPGKELTNIMKDIMSRSSELR